MTEPKKEIEKTYQFAKHELAEFLGDLRDQVDNRSLKIGDKTIELPENYDVEFGYKFEDEKNEIELELKWS